MACFRSRTLLAVSALAAAACACGPGDLDLRSGRDFVPDAGDYRLRWLDPPWRPAEPDGAEVRLVVESPFVESDGAGLTYDLTVARGGSTAARRAMRDVARAAGRGERSLYDDGPRELVTESGDVGVDVAFLEDAFPTRYRRSTYFDLPAGGTVEVRVRSFPLPDDDPELDAMLRAFDVLPVP